MSKKATPGRSRRQGLRQRAIRDRLVAWRLRARRAATLGLMTAGFAISPASAWAQLGQTAMAPAGGVVNRAVAGFQDLNQNGPGVIYYGINAADRGLGYVGSYMTLGGFVPAFEDDLGGFWAADLRGHLSEYGGFFSNVGAVRKQFIGGTLLGVGVYWDYDGDLNQYPDVVIPSKGSSYIFPGGQIYNQVGISGEWLTDYGNLRSNGYIPVGTTAQLAGPFVGNSLLCVNGVNAALSGADLEVGAYIPGLADWAGMVSVGGYALGNARYDFADGQNAVPWFGGVYTRLDMTFVENWDFSLQANNDSYFDWTGFARLTYRMGGSRRRNVPDQVEQPMMRNEHIVRAHQAPVVATNPNNLDAAGNPLPWQVVHVDNSADSPGNGTAESPFQTLAAAEATAVAAYDIVYVHVGDSYTSPYMTPAAGYSFGNVNQYLIGEGSTLQIPTVSCGNRSLLATSQSNLYPQISNPIGAAINVDQAGVTVDHVQIRNSNVGIADGAGFAAPGVATISDVIISGGGGPFQRGVLIANSNGRFDFDNVRLTNIGNDGFLVSAADGDVTITNSSLTDARGTGVLVSGAGASVSIQSTSLTRIDGTAVAATGDSAEIKLTGSKITDTQGILGQAALASGTDSKLIFTDTAVTNSAGAGIVGSGTNSNIGLTGSNVTGTGAAGLVASGTGSTASLINSVIATTGDDGVVASGANTTLEVTRSQINQVGGIGIAVTGQNVRLNVTESKASDTLEEGIAITGDNATAAITDTTVTGTRLAGIRAESTTPSNATTVTLLRTTVRDSQDVGVAALGLNGPDEIFRIFESTITNTDNSGVLVRNSNVDIGRDPDATTGVGTIIVNTRGGGIDIGNNPGLNPGKGFRTNVRVTDTTISQTFLGIDAAAGDFANEITLTARRNTITTSTEGTGISVSAVFDRDLFTPVSRIFADIRGNRINPSGGDGILLTTVGGPTQTDTDPPAYAPAALKPISVAAADIVNLSNLNLGTSAVEIPAENLGADPPVRSSINFDPAVAPLPAP